MDAERLRSLVLPWPDVVETMQWGDKLVFWAGDKAIGGKMFCLLDLGGTGRALISFAAGHERAAELLEREGLFPAPYLARAGWVAAERWNALGPGEWESELRAARDATLARLPRRTRDVLALPTRKQAACVAQARAAASFRDKPPSRKRLSL